MKFTKGWLKDHLKINKTEAQIIEKLNNLGLEVEKVEPVKKMRSQIRFESIDALSTQISKDADMALTFLGP